MHDPCIVQRLLREARISGQGIYVYGDQCGSAEPCSTIMTSSGDEAGGVISPEEVDALLKALPIGRANLLTFDLMPIGPLTPPEMLIK